MKLTIKSMPDGDSLMIEASRQDMIALIKELAGQMEETESSFRRHGHWSPMHWQIEPLPGTLVRYLSFKRVDDEQYGR